jgi:hypothetical protein
MTKLCGAALLALVACGSSAPPAAPSNKAPAPSYAAALDDVLGFLPVDSEIVVGIDGNQIRHTAIWSQVAPKLEQAMGEDLQQVRTACGFDPFATVERISIGLRAVEQDRMAGVIVARGVGAGTMGCVRTRFGKGGAVIDDKGVLVMDHHGDRIKTAWTVVGTSLVVQVGQDVGHDSMQVVLGSGSPLRGSSAFMTIYNRLGKGTSVWGIVNGRSKLFDELSGSGMRPVAMEGALTLSDRVQLAGIATFDTPDTATKVDGLLKATFPQIQRFVERSESRVDGAAVDVRLDMTGAQLMQLLGNF